MPILKKDKNFFSAEDFKNEEIVTIESEGEEQDGQYGKKLVVMIKRGEGENEELAKLTLNSTSKNNMIDAYGKNSSEWIKKEAKVFLMTTNIGGNMKRVIYLVHPNKDLEGHEINS